MPSLRKKKGHYYARFYDPQRQPKQKEFSLRTKTKSVARQKLAQLERDHAMGLFDPWTDPVPEEGVVVLQAVRRFIKSRERKNLRPKTIEVYSETLNRFAKTLPPDMTIAQVGPKEVRAFVEGPELAAASRATYYTQLRTFFRWGVEVGLSKQDITAQVEKPRTGKKEAEYMTPSEVEQLIATIKADAKSKGGLVLPGQNVWMVDVIRLTVCTGLRRGEVCNLRWSDLDLDAGFLIVRNRDDFETKSGHERRIPLVRDALDVVRRLDANREAGDGFVFAGRGGNRRDPRYVSRRFRHFRKMAGLSDGIHFHSLRHTAASWLVMRGVPLPMVKEILGHSDIAVTQRYAHLAPGAMRSEMERAFREIENDPSRVGESAVIYTLAA